MFRGKQLASLYKAYRPVYSPALVQRILKFARENNDQVRFDLAVDVGCGSGQFTSLLSPHYTSVIGIDESVAQIKEAELQNQYANVTFSVCYAENTVLEDGLVDLVTAAQCIHWLNADKFYVEVKRILKPKGTLAIVTYRNPILETTNKGSEVSKMMTEISDEVFAFFRDNKYMDARAVISKYHGEELEVPFTNVEKDASIFMEQPSTINDYVGFVSSTSHYANFAKDNPNEINFLEKLRNRLLEVSGQSENIPILLKYRLDLTLACMS